MAARACAVWTIVWLFAPGPAAHALLEAGVILADANPLTVDLIRSYTSPVVVCTVQYDNNTTPTVVRVNNVTASSFDVRLEHPSGGAVAAETVSYLVVEEGAWTIDGVKVEAQSYISTITDENGSWVGESQGYAQGYTNPVVLGQVMTENDAWSVFWCQGATVNAPPSAASLRTGKTVCEDTDTTRLDETVGFIVFESWHGTIAGVEFEAALGPDVVQGVGDMPPYAYNFNTPFASPPQAAIASMAGVDGNNGAWAQAHGPAVATTSTLFLSVDEDVIGDTERDHTTEQVGYVVFASPVVFPECVDPAECDDGLYCTGVEQCVAGSCAAGAPVTCDDGVSCTDDFCNETKDSCAFVPNDAICDDGEDCNGSEMCDPGSGCQPGIAVDFSSGSYSGSEAGSGIIVTVQLTAPSCVPVTVDFAVSDDTATSPDDYMPVRATITLEPGETEKTVTVTALDDGEREGDETALLSLSNPTNVRLADVHNPAMLTIRDPREVEIARISTTRYGLCGGMGLVSPFVGVLGLLVWKTRLRHEPRSATGPRKHTRR